MKFGIRKAEQTDLPEIQSLLKELTEKEIKNEEVANRFHMVEGSPIDELFVCELDHQVQGLMGFRMRENLDEVSRYGEVSVIVTSSSSRRIGIGKALMDYAEGLAKERGCKGTWLVSGLNREDAHRFYAKLGYLKTGYRLVKLFSR